MIQLTSLAYVITAIAGLVLLLKYNLPTLTKHVYLPSFLGLYFITLSGGAEVRSLFHALFRAEVEVERTDIRLPLSLRIEQTSQRTNSSQVCHPCLTMNQANTTNSLSPTLRIRPAYLNAYWIITLILTTAIHIPLLAKFDLAHTAVINGATGFVDYLNEGSRNWQGGVLDESVIDQSESCRGTKSLTDGKQSSIC